MTHQISTTQIQFSDKYEPEKLRRLADDLVRVERALNTMIEEIRDLQQRVTALGG